MSRTQRIYNKKEQKHYLYHPYRQCDRCDFYRNLTKELGDSKQHLSSQHRAEMKRLLYNEIENI